MKKAYYLLFVCGCSLQAQVGIGNTSPQKDLHIAGSTSTIRIEQLNSVNTPALNKGGTSLTPVFVDKDGELTLYPPGYLAGGGAPSSVPPMNFLINVGNFIPDNPDGGGVGRGTIVNSPTTSTSNTLKLIEVPFTSPAAGLIEVKYGVTVLISAGDLTVPTYTAFTDKSTRTFQVYYCIDLNSDGLDATELSKRYGDKGQMYASGVQGIIGYPYMNSHGYSDIPPGNHKLVFFGVVNDGVNKFTSVGFGGDLDYLKIRIYN